MPHRTRILDPMPAAQAELYQQILLREGIDVEVVGGDLPGTFTRLLVPDDQVELAEAFLDTFAAGEDTVSCPACGEDNPEDFVDCWNCGASLAGDGTDRKRWPGDEVVDEGSGGASSSPWAWVVTALVLLLIFAWYARWFSVSALLE